MNYARIRLGGHVKRYHTVQVHKEQTVAAHSWGVATILLDVCHPGDIDVSILKDALYHDVAEYDTGDVPAQAKWANPKLGLALGDLERAIEEKLEIQPNSDNHPLLKAADLLELLWYCFEETRMGNKNTKDIFYRGYTALQNTINTIVCHRMTLYNIRYMAEELKSEMINHD